VQTLRYFPADETNGGGQSFQRLLGFSVVALDHHETTSGARIASQHNAAYARQADARVAEFALDDDLAALRRLLADPDLLEGKRAVLHFGLAHVLDARGEYGEAAEHLRQANALSLAVWRKRGEIYDPANHTQFVADMIALGTPAFFERVRGWGLDSERPVFIVGLPRSGTTLVEQVLASHSQVFGAGELRFARDDFESLPSWPVWVRNRQVVSVNGTIWDYAVSLDRLRTLDVPLLAVKGTETTDDLTAPPLQMAGLCPRGWR